jgi:hypothetical protein
MTRKSISVALCFSTVLSSISWSMEASPSQASSSSAQSRTLTLSPTAAFYVDNSTTQNVATQDIQAAAGQAFLQGASHGFASYASDTRDLLRNIWNGNISEISQSSLQSLIQQSLGTNLRRYQERNTTAHARGELDAESVKALFSLVRNGIYHSLMRTGAFGSPRRVFIPERNVTETHYDVTLSASASFVNAILPNVLPLRGVLISLINNSTLNTFLLNQIDGLFARLTVKYFEQLTGIKLNQAMIGTLGLVGLSGVALSGTAIQSALSDYENAEALPTLTQEIPHSFSELWRYLNPRLSHYVRDGIIESVVGLAGLSADKISDPAGLAMARAIHNNSQFITGTIGFMGYSIGESLTAVPLIDGAFGAGIAYWASNGVLQAALPRGLDESRRKIIDMTMNALRLTATYYVNQFLPITPTEHHLFGLNPNPSATELALFREDYEARDTLNQQSVVAALARDVASAISTPLTTLLAASGLPQLASALLGTSDNKDGLALLTAPQGHAQASHNDTAARIKLFELARALDDIAAQKSDFTQNAAWYNRALAYWKGELPNQLKLTTEQQQLLDTLRKHPSFEFLKAELEHLAKHYTWLSRDDKAQKLQPYEAERQALSKEFTDDARTVLAKIEQARKVLEAKHLFVDATMNTLMTGLSLDHFIIALDALINKEILEQFDFNRPITDLPGFAVALQDYASLLKNHEGLVRLIQTSSLGMGKTLTKQLDLAQRLATIDNVDARLAIQTVDQSIPEVETLALHTRYLKNVKKYLLHVYGPVFLEQAGQTEIDAIVKSFPAVVITEGEVPQEYVQKCWLDLNKNSKFQAFKRQLRELNLDKSVETAIYQQIVQQLIEKKFASEQQNTDKPAQVTPAAKSSWMNWNWPWSSGASSAAASSADLGADASDWVIVSEDSAGPSEIVTYFTMRDIDCLPLETFEDQGFEAYYVAKIIKDMIQADPNAFDGRLPFALTAQDMLKVTQHIDSVRRSQIISSEDLMLINRHATEFAALVQTAHASSVIWTYDTLLTELRKQVSDKLASVLPISDSSGSGSSDSNGH